MTQPTIIITGEPTWASDVQDALADEYRVHQQPETNGYMNAIIESLAALVLVDGADDEWGTWTSVPKSSPATRRVPIVLVTDTIERETARKQGADLTMSADDLLGGLTDLLDNHARLPDPQRQEQLDCDCAEPLPERAREGIRMFNEGQYYKQHDLFEEEWMETESPVRDLYRAILQVGVAYFQIERGNYRGAVKMLQRSVQWLVVLPDECQGVDVKKLREDSFRVRDELERLGEDRFDEFDSALLQGVEWTPTDA